MTLTDPTTDSDLTNEIDVASHDAYMDGVPFDQFARLRAEAPVFRHRQVEPEQPLDGFWIVTRHADCVKVNRQWENFSSQRKGAILTEDRPDLEFARMLIDLDPPEHARLRQLVSRGFTPKVIKSMDGHFREVANRIIGDAVANGTFDFVTDIAAELPLYAIAQLLGLPQEDRHKVFKWSNAMIGAAPMPAMRKREGVQLVGQLATDPRTSPWPADLFAAKIGERRLHRTVALSDGSQGEVDVLLKVAALLPCGIPASFERVITTQLAGTRRVSHELWTLELAPSN